MEGNGMRQAIHITLRGRYNITYSGTLILHGNITSRLAPVEDVSLNGTRGEEGYDATGASYYVIAVVLVYGMSIVALIASHIKRRHDKMSEDKQIDKYLQDFQIIKEIHARDNYKNLKKSVMNKINWDRKKGTHRTLQKSILPLLAIGMQVGAGRTVMETSQPDGHHKGKRKVYPIGTKRHSDPDISDSTKLIEVTDPRPLRVRRHSCMDQPYVQQEGGVSLHLLTIPDTHYTPAGVHLTHAMPPMGGGVQQAPLNETACARRLRFSTSAMSVSHLDRSLNSIAEREEDEEKDMTPPRQSRSVLTSSLSSGSTAAPHGSLDHPLSIPVPAPVSVPGAGISKLSKLRRIGVSLPPSADAFPEHMSLSQYPSIPAAGRADEAEYEISVRVDDVHVWATPANNSSPGSSLGISEEDESTPVTSPMTSYPVSIMVEDDNDDDDDLDGLGRIPRDPDEVYFEEDEEEPMPPRRRRMSADEMMEECKYSPQTLLASIKFTGGTLTPNGSPRRSRSASITSLMTRRNSKDRRRSAGSGTRDFDGLVEVVDDNPLHITCL